MWLVVLFSAYRQKDKRIKWPPPGPPLNPILLERNTVPTRKQGCALYCNVWGRLRKYKPMLLLDYQLNAVPLTRSLTHSLELEVRLVQLLPLLVGSIVSLLLSPVLILNVFYFSLFYIFYLYSFFSLY